MARRSGISSGLGGARLAGWLDGPDAGAGFWAARAPGATDTAIRIMTIRMGAFVRVTPPPTTANAPLPGLQNFRNPLPVITKPLDLSFDHFEKSETLRATEAARCRDRNDRFPDQGLDHQLRQEV